MKTRILKMTMPFLFAWLFAGISFGQRGPMNFTDSIPGITKDQKIKLASIREAQRLDMEELHEKLKNAATWEESDKIEHQLIDTRTKHRNEMRAVLTPDQQKFFDQNFFNMHKKHMEIMHEKGPKGRHGKGMKAGKDCPMHMGEGGPGGPEHRPDGPSPRHDE